MHNVNFRTVEDENTKQKKDISISKKFEKKKKSDLKTEIFKLGIMNEKSFITEVDMKIEDP
jgi:hypothetical protein